MERQFDNESIDVLFEEMLSTLETCDADLYVEAHIQAGEILQRLKNGADCPKAFTDNEMAIRVITMLMDLAEIGGTDSEE